MVRICIKYLFLGFVLLMIVNKTFSQLSVDHLRCEYMPDPSPIDVMHPSLSWINKTIKAEQNQYQSAFQIQVSSDNAFSLIDMWDSGKRLSASSNHIKYNGKPLEWTKKYYWRVRVWDKKNKKSAWSKVASWRMGLPHDQWTAQWIGAPWQGEEIIPKPAGGPQNRTAILPPHAPWLRKSFTIAKPIKEAVVFTTGLGYFELYANGTRISDDQLVPNQTNYSTRPNLSNSLIALPDTFAEYSVMYMAYDITAYLKKDKNVIGAILGNGWYNAPKFWSESYGSPRFIAQVKITFTDGTTEFIHTDTSWKAARSPIVWDLIYDGEYYDARLENKDWCTTLLDDSDWEPVRLRSAPYGSLVAHTAPTDKITKILPPLHIQRLENGNIKVDFEEEISGWVRLKNISGPEGVQIKINFISNQFSGENLYTFNGKQNQSYAPRFNWFVFSSVEIENWPGDLRTDQIQAEAVNTQVDEIAHFETSNPLFNQIHKIWKRSQLDNMHGGIASDCPHRERSPYTGDGQVACHTVMNNFDAAGFYKKWIKDVRAAQIPTTGYVPNSAPWQPGSGGGVAWGAAIHIMPWEFYIHYGDTSILVENYTAMQGYMRYMKSWVGMNGIMHSERLGKDGKPLKWWNLGEWAGISDDKMPPDELVHTFYYWYCADITATVAHILGKLQDEKKYQSIADETKTAFIKTFYNTAQKSFGRYGANIFALKMGLPSDLVTIIRETIRKDQEANNRFLETGIFGTRFLFELFSEHGMHDLAYDAMNKTDPPSFGHWVTIGSTTTREHWNDRSSHNHPMFGGGLSWFYSHLAGLRIDASNPGYKSIIFKPQPHDQLKSAKYSIKTMQGDASIHWQNDSHFSMRIIVPVGSNATVYVPYSKNKMVINKTGKNYSKYKIGEEDGYQLFKVGSGDWDFLVK